MPPFVMKATEIINSSQFRSSSLIELMILELSLFYSNLGRKLALEVEFSSTNAVLAPFKISI